MQEPSGDGPSKKREPREHIPERQWELVAGYRASGEMVTLREIAASSDADIRPLDDLNDDERAALTAERIGRQQQFKIGLVGVGVLDKQRAIEEVQKRSAAGRTLMNIEQRMIRMMIEEARKSARRSR